MNYLFSSQDTTLSGYSNVGLAKLVSSHGEYGQTAAFPNIGNQQAWRKNRRIYEGDSNSTAPYLVTSAQYFFKTTDEDKPIQFTGYSDGMSKYMLSNPITDDKALRLKPKNTGRSDTLATEWFSVNDHSTL
jgi:hypothetical protein